jgi:hypothetical protein
LRIGSKKLLPESVGDFAILPFLQKYPFLQFGRNPGFHPSNFPERSGTPVLKETAFPYGLADFNSPAKVIEQFFQQFFLDGKS